LTTSPSGFPLNTGTLDFMQQSYTETVQALANLAGSTDVIVSGCVRAGDLVGPGWLFVGGELLYFVGGDAGTTTLLLSTETAVAAENQNGQEVDRYFNKTLSFDAAGTINFSDLRRAGSLLELQRQAASLVAFESAVIVEGCLVSAVTTGSIAIAPGTYVLDGAFVASASYSGAYPVYFNAALGYTTADPGGTRVMFDPYTSQRKEDVIARATTRKGTLVDVATDILTNFDSTTGLGKWSWKGFALANGSNGTADLRGRTRFGYDPDRQEYNTPGGTGGAETVTLTETQMPMHAHGSPNAATLPAGEFGLIRRSVNGQDATIAASDAGQSGTEPDVKTSPIPIPPAGGNQPHENRPPFVVSITVQRI
jgi:microcystin-dependent protein